ncbi:MAG: SitA5 family polymorphic toxin [Archangium sp.]
MSARLLGQRPSGARLRPLLGGWFLLILFLQSACATSAPLGGLTAGYRYRSLAPPPAPPERVALTEEPGLESASVYELGFMEPGAVATRPVPIHPAEFQQAFQRLTHEVRLGAKTPKEAARELLSLVQQPPQGIETVASNGDWNLEAYGGRGYTLVPERQEGPVRLTPEADEALKARYLQWCEHQGGGDCMGLLDDGPYLRTDDRRTLALALAFGRVLDETREALGRELLDVRALVSMVVWTVGLYCMMWLVPEPTTKALAATLTVILMGWLGLKTVYGLMDGWARMAIAAHEATTFEELRAAGEEFGKVLGEDAARALIMAVGALMGRTLGEVAARVKSLPGFNMAGAQWRAQGGAAALESAEALETAPAQEGALAKAVAAVETVATSPQGPLAVVMLKKGQGSGAATAPGGRSAQTVIRHRGGNRQVQLSDGQRWHIPRGKSLADIPAEDKVGDMLQEAVTKAAEKWGPDKLSRKEQKAIDDALKEGEYWLARLLEREARGRFVEDQVERQFGGTLKWNHQGVDVIDLETGRKYEILSGTASNLARHGRRMAGEFFRMITF